MHGLTMRMAGCVRLHLLLKVPLVFPKLADLAQEHTDFGC